VTGVVKTRHGGLPEVLVAFAASWSFASRHYLAGYVCQSSPESATFFEKISLRKVLCDSKSLRLSPWWC
jgi:hypothetical protein